MAKTLTELGYHVSTGADVHEAKAMMGVPSKADIVKHMQRALDQEADKAWVDKMAGGQTGVVGVMAFARPGPVVALRVDMDANDLVEAAEDKHRPFKEGFASINKGAMHACGHDGHTAVGLSMAEVLARVKNELAGTVKLIFQPAEEGVWSGCRQTLDKRRMSWSAPNWPPVIMTGFLILTKRPWCLPSP